MRKHLFPFLALLLLGISSCQNSDNAQAMLQDESQRRQVFNTIIENEEMRNEFMGMMRAYNMSGPMGQGGMMHERGAVGDTTGMGDINRQQMQANMQQVMAMCETDTAACNLMSQMMLQHMQQRGLIDTTCMQQIQKRMGTTK